MSRETNLKAQERFGELIASREVDRLDEVFAEDVLDHDPAPGQAPGVRGVIDFWVDLLAAFPDLELIQEALVADDEHVTVVLTIAGTHDGTFHGIEPTGVHITGRSIQVARFEDGRIVERWGATNEVGIMRQLGI